MLVYKITNIVNNKEYVGQTTKSLEERFANHCYKSNSKNTMPICKAISKYGKENFKIEKICECGTLEELYEKEMLYVNQYNTWAPNGYNIKAGKWSPISEESRNKIKESKIGKKLSQETKDKISKAHKGIPLSEAHKQALSKAFKGVPLSETHKEAIKVGRAKKPKRQWPEAQYKHYCVTAQLLSPDNVETTVFNVEKFARENGLNGKNLSAVVNGKRKSCKGWTLYVLEKIVTANE